MKLKFVATDLKTFRRISIILYHYFPTAEATMMLFVVYHAELTRRNALYQFGGMYGISPITSLFQACGMIFRRVTDLESHLFGIYFICQHMEVMNIEILFIGGERFITFAYIEDVLSHIFLHGIPRTAAKTETVTLSDGVKP